MKKALLFGLMLLLLVVNVHADFHNISNMLSLSGNAKIIFKDDFKFKITLVGLPASTLSFFMTDPFASSDAGNEGAIDSNDFDEWPIELGDYGKTSQKCSLWSCSSFSSSLTDHTGMLCTGGWDCLQYEGYSCKQWKCLGWANYTPGYLYYSSSGWTCGVLNYSTCDSWQTNVWTSALNPENDMYCSGEWNCNQWQGTTCKSWNCTSWMNGTTSKRDSYCASGWNCLNFTDGMCNGWNCSFYLETTADNTDKYCNGTFSCNIWNNSACAFWNCTEWQQYAARSDYSCDKWNCSLFNSTTHACNDWKCLSWAPGTVDRDRYCSGAWNCIAWKSYI